MNYTYTFDKKCETFEDVYQDVLNAINLLCHTIAENDVERLQELIRLGKLNLSSICFKGKSFSYILKKIDADNYQQYISCQNQFYRNLFDLVTNNQINLFKILYDYQIQITHKERIINEKQFFNIFLNSIMKGNDTFIQFFLNKIQDWNLDRVSYQSLYVYSLNSKIPDLSDKINNLAKNKSIDIFSSNTILKQAIHSADNTSSAFIFDMLYAKSDSPHKRGILSKTLIKLLENKIYLTFEQNNEFKIVDHILTLIKKANGDEEKTALIFTNLLFKHSTGFGTFVVENKLREYLFTIQHYKWFQKQIPILCAKYTIQENNIDLYLYIQNFFNYQKLNKTLIVPNLKSVNKI